MEQMSQNVLQLHGKTHLYKQTENVYLQYTFRMQLLTIFRSCTTMFHFRQKYPCNDKIFPQLINLQID